jgi:hypothetical protein
MVAILVIALAVIASSCAPAAPAATPAAPAATPAAPAATPVAPAPAAPAATPAAPATHTWGDSATYTNDTVGFTIQYPSKWIIIPPTGGDVFTAAAGSGGTDDTIHVTVIPAVTDFGQAAKGILDSSAAFVQYKVKSNLDSSGPITLASGSVTNANQAALSAKIIVYQFYFYAVGATKGANTVGVLGQTIGGGNAKKQIQEICQSLSFK